MRRLIPPIVLLLLLVPVVAGAAWTWSLVHPGTGENLPTGAPYRFEVSCDPLVSGVQVYIPTYLQPPVSLSKDPYVPGMWTGYGTVTSVPSGIATNLYILLTHNNSTETHSQTLLLVPPTTTTTTKTTTTTTSTATTVQTLSGIPTPTPPPTAAPGDVLTISAPDALWTNNQFEVQVSHIIYNGQLKWSILDQNGAVAEDNSGTMSIRMSEDTWSDTLMVELNTPMSRLEPGAYHIYVKVLYLQGKLGPRIQSTGGGGTGTSGGFSYAEYSGEPLFWGDDVITTTTTSTQPPVQTVSTAPPPQGPDLGILAFAFPIVGIAGVLVWYAYSRGLFKRQSVESPKATTRPSSGRRLM